MLSSLLFVVVVVDCGFWFLAFGVAALAGHWLLPIGLCYLSFAHILKMVHLHY